MERLRAVLDWVFRDRTTGKIVIAQFPNAALLTWLGATLVAAVTEETAHTVAGYVATGGLLVWAGDELLRGVNPFRRALGAVVLTWQVVSLLHR